MLKNNKIFLTNNVVNNNSTINLYCIPSAGSSASMYSGWQKYAPSYLTIYPIEYPGHGFRLNEPLIANPDDIAQEITDAILTKDEKPFILFGHSIGSAILWKIVKYIEQKKQSNRIILLAVSGRPETSYLRKEKNIHSLPKEQFIEKILYYSNLPEEIHHNSDFLDFFIPIIRNDFEMNEKTHYDEKIQTNVPLIVFSGDKDPDTNETSLQAWSSYSTLWLGYHILPGHHFYINEEENYQKILELIQYNIKNLGALIE